MCGTAVAGPGLGSTIGGGAGGAAGCGGCEGAAWAAAADAEDLAVLRGARATAVLGAARPAVFLARSPRPLAAGFIVRAVAVLRLVERLFTSEPTSSPFAAMD